jgi:hypothetical protein
MQRGLQIDSGYHLLLEKLKCTERFELFGPIPGSHGMGLVLDTELTNNGQWLNTTYIVEAPKENLYNAD